MAKGNLHGQFEENMIGCGVLQARARTSELSLFVLLGAVVVVTTVEIRVKWRVGGGGVTCFCSLS